MPWHSDIPVSAPTWAGSRTQPASARTASLVRVASSNARPANCRLREDSRRAVAPRWPARPRPGSPATVFFLARDPFGPPHLAVTSLAPAVEPVADGMDGLDLAGDDDASPLGQG